MSKATVTSYWYVRADNPDTALGLFNSAVCDVRGLLLECGVEGLELDESLLYDPEVNEEGSGPMEITAYSLVEASDSAQALRTFINAISRVEPILNKYGVIYDEVDVDMLFEEF